jgi:Up-Regulated in long-lived daf-2
VDLVTPAGPDEEVTVTDKRTAQVTVRNDFDNPATVKITHKYGSGGVPETSSWERVPSGEAGSPPLTVHYETGFGSKWDYWQISVDVLEGRAKGTYQSGDKECYLKEEDQGTLHTFTVSPQELKINLISSGCEATITKTA